MKLQEHKMELAKMILSTDSKIILQQVQAVFDKEETDFWDELSPYQQQVIEKALKEADNGETVSHSEAMKKYKKWL